ncbi:MAG: hypothetical protein KIG51_02465, partial [Fibrobacter sp.]|nr:hypothetical protein [Fibrobacter sp.]
NPTGLSGNSHINYNTTDGYFYYTTNAGSNWTKSTSCCLPLARVTWSSDNKIVSIDQVFNGFGYIGSTIFALPGIKCLVGNGRNPDGSCITKIEESTKVSTLTTTLNRKNNKIVLYNGNVGVGAHFLFNEQANMCYDDNSVNPVYRPMAILGTFSTETSSPWNIKEFNPLGVDSLANSNASNFSKAGESYLSGLGMPSGRYIDLTLGANGSTYTAPANGYFVLWSSLNSSQYNKYIAIHKLNQSTVGSSFAYEAVVPSEYQIPLVAPVKCGEIITIAYTIGAAMFRFYYAEGETNV